MTVAMMTSKQKQWVLRETIRLLYPLTPTAAICEAVDMVSYDYEEPSILPDLHIRVDNIEEEYDYGKTEI